jgi:hypothetical protein
MGRTTTANRGNNLKNEKNSLKNRGVSWESIPARVKASGRGAKFTRAEIINSFQAIRVFVGSFY